MCIRDSGSFEVLKFRSIMSTDLSTFFAADTQLLIYMRFACTVHFHFSGAGTAAHTDVFQSSAKTGAFMSFEMGEGKEYVGIHDCASDFRFFYVFTALDRYIDLVSSLQTIGDDDMASSRERRKTICVSTFHVFQSVLSGPHI